MKSLESDYLWNIFTELAQHSFVVPLQSNVTLHAMSLFGGYDISYGILVAFGAIVAVSSCNYIIGRGVALMEKKLPKTTQEVFEKGRRFFAGLGIVVLCFFWLPMGGVLPLVAGICRAPFIRVLAMVMLGAAISLYNALAF